MTVDWDKKDYAELVLFESFMPELMEMRKEGYSFRQIAMIFEQIGFPISESKVHTYYAHFLSLRSQECEAQLTRALLFLDRIKKITGA